MLTAIRRSQTARMIGKRLLLAIPVLWGTTFFTFCLLNLLPGSAATALLGDSATPAQVAALEQKLKLDEPFFQRYLDWLGHALTGNLGDSLASGQGVTSLVLKRLGVSFELVILAMAVALIVALPVAALAARRPRGLADRVSVGLSTIGLSVPNFVFALLLVYVLSVKLHVLPALGYVSIGTDLGQNLRFLIMPVLSLAFGLFCVFNRLLRADIVDQLQGEDYVVTARAKGVRPWVVLVRHAMRNSLFGLLTVAGLQLGALIGSTVVIEQVFGVPGIGQELLRAIQGQDVPVVTGIVVVVAIFVVLANLITDLLYAVLDPRIRHERPSS